MKIEQYKINKQFHVNSILDNYSLISQNIDKISIHEVEEQYLLLSTELGYFNKLTNFIVGNKSSLLFLNEQSELVYPDIRDVIKNNKNYFLLYPIPAINNENNTELKIEIEKNLFGKVNFESVDVKLDTLNGFTFGKKFLRFKTYENITLTHIERALNGSNNPDYFWPDKNIVVNSNAEFALSILIGYLWQIKNINRKNTNSFYIHKNDNIYIFATILNYLGASYYIQNVEEFNFDEIEGSLFDKLIQIRLPIYYKNILEKIYNDLLENEFIDEDEKEEFFSYFHIIKKYEWLQNDRKQIRRFHYNNFITKLEKKPFTNELNKTILDGIILIPASSIRFEKIKSDKKEILYDFTSDRADATNYSLGFTPILKNSDGDILTLSTAFSKEALEDAKVFEPSSKEWFRNLNNGQINKYIKDDALLGLYALTKYK